MEAEKVELQFCEAQIRQEESTVPAGGVTAGISPAALLGCGIIHETKILSGKSVHSLWEQMCWCTFNQRSGGKAL